MSSDSAYFSYRAGMVGAALGGALLATAIALPWAGWAGLRTVGPTIGLLAAGALGFAVRRGSCQTVRLATAGAAVSGALIVWRLASPASPTSILGNTRSTSALVIGLVGSIAVVLTGVLWVMHDRLGLERRRVLTRDAERRAALGSVWRATWTSRTVVWTAGVLGVLKLGIEPSVQPTPALARPFGSLGNLLTAPASAWDAGNYLLIAQYGYAPASYLRAYFPGYPVLVRLAAWSPQASLVAAILVSVGAFMVALYLLYRLVALERGREDADLSILLVAFSPMALFFSAVYSESVFLAFSVGAFYAARRGWWARAGVAGAIAAATRITGVVLLLPLIVLYLYGPREDRANARGEATAAPPRGGLRPAVRRLYGSLAPRYQVRADLGYMLLIPAGAAAYLAYSGVHGDLLGPLHAEHAYWFRRFIPGLGAVHGLIDAIQSLRQLAVGPAVHVLSTPTYQAAGQLSDPMKLAAADLTDFGFLVFGCVAAIGAVRRLPAAYGVYAVAMIAVTVSTFGSAEPLFSFPRFLLVVFPCQMWLAQWANSPGRRQATLLFSCGALAFFASQFATWRWVA